MIDTEAVKAIEERLREINPDRPPRYRRLASREQYHKQWQLKNRISLNDYNRQRYKNNINGEKDKATIRRNKRRILELGALGSHTFEEWQLLVNQYQNRCAYCGKKSNKLERDHIIPLYVGGSDNIDNITPACPQCNRSKQAKNLNSWDKFKGLQLNFNNNSLP